MNDDTQSRRSFLRKSAAVAGGSVVAGSAPAAAKTSPSEIDVHAHRVPGEYELVDVIHKGFTGVRRGYKVRYDVPQPMEDVMVTLASNFTGRSHPKTHREVTMSGTGTITVSWWQPNITDIVISKGEDPEDFSWLWE